jgi:hypothetical protein
MLTLIDILVSDHLAIIFSILDSVTSKETIESLEKFTDLEGGKKKGKKKAQWPESAN